MTDAVFKEKIDNLPSFAANHKHDINHVTEEAPGQVPEDSVKTFMLGFKNKMKLLTTRVVKLDLTDEVSVMEKGFSRKKLKQGKGQGQKKKKRDAKETVKGEDVTKSSNATTSFSVSKGDIANTIQQAALKDDSAATTTGCLRNLRLPTRRRI